MEERKFECGEKVYIEKVVAQCSCLLKEKIEIRGRVVERDGSDGIFIHISFSLFSLSLLSLSLSLSLSLACVRADKCFFS